MSKSVELLRQTELATHWGMYLPESWPIVTWFWDRLLELVALHQRCRHRGNKNLCNHDTYGYLVTLELYIWGGGFPPNHRHISFRCLVISSCSCLCSYCPAAFLILLSIGGTMYHRCIAGSILAKHIHNIYVYMYTGSIKHAPVKFVWWPLYANLVCMCSHRFGFRQVFGVLLQLGWMVWSSIAVQLYGRCILLPPTGVHGWNIDASIDFPHTIY